MQRTTPLMLAGLMAAGAAFAAETIDFNSYDANGDGYLTESEWSDANQANIEFDTIDTNRDGYLDEAEVTAGMSADTQSVTGGQATEDDYSPTEYDPTAQGQIATEQQTGEPTGGTTGGTSSGTGEATGSTVSSTAAQSIDDASGTTISTTGGEGQERDVSLYDTDSDGRVSRGEAEVDGELVTNFVVWDSNQDGYLNQEELETGSQQSDTSTSGDIQRDQRVDTQSEDAGGMTESTGMQTSGGEDSGYSTSGVSTGMENDTGSAGQFTTLDVNGDGLLDETEAAEDDYINANFDAWDTDRDGFVSEDEASVGWTDGGSTMQEDRR